MQRGWSPSTSHRRNNVRPLFHCLLLLWPVLRPAVHNGDLIRQQCFIFSRVCHAPHGGPCWLADDKFRASFLWGRKPMLAACAARMAEKEGLVWVDLGGGTGVRTLTPRVTGIHILKHIDRHAQENVDLMSQYLPLSAFKAIYVVDLCSALCEQARRKVAANGWTNVHVIEGDACTYRPPEDNVDLVTFSYSLSSAYCKHSMRSPIIDTQRANPVCHAHSDPRFPCGHRWGNQVSAPDQGPAGRRRLFCLLQARPAHAPDAPAAPHLLEVRPPLFSLNDTYVLHMNLSSLQVHIRHGQHRHRARAPRLPGPPPVAHLGDERPGMCPLLCLSKEKMALLGK